MAPDFVRSCASCSASAKGPSSTVQTPAIPTSPPASATSDASLSEPNPALAVQADTGRAYARGEEDYLPQPLKLPADLLSTSRVLPASKRTTISNLPRNCFEVRGLLSKKECEGLVKVAEEKGLSDVSWEYDPVWSTFVCAVSVSIGWCRVSASATAS